MLKIDVNSGVHNPGAEKSRKLREKPSIALRGLGSPFGGGRTHGIVQSLSGLGGRRLALCRNAHETHGGLLRRGPFSTAIPALSAGGLKPEIVARVRTTRPGCYRAIVFKDFCQGQPGPARSCNASKHPGSLPRHCNHFHLAIHHGRLGRPVPPVPLSPNNLRKPKTSPSERRYSEQPEQNRVLLQRGARLSVDDVRISRLRYCPHQACELLTTTYPSFRRPRNLPPPSSNVRR